MYVTHHGYQLKEHAMQITSTGQMTSEAQVQAMVSGMQTPSVQHATNTHVTSSATHTTQAISSDHVSISAQAQALAKSEVGESTVAESSEAIATQATEGESSRVQGA